MPLDAKRNLNRTPSARTWPEGFLWGSATAAAQVEGASHEGGKEDSVWDAFARVPGAIAHGDTLKDAVQHYHRMPEDVAIMKDLGLDSYRFSTSWSRVRPGDRGPNKEGLDFYSRLVDELLGAGILPWLTLYHWDLPQALEEKGGWANRDTAYRFVDYANDVYSALGDRVQHWTTFNEPFCSSLLATRPACMLPGARSRMRPSPRSTTSTSPPATGSIAKRVVPGPCPPGGRDPACCQLQVRGLRP